jgi:hypothetical protein
VLLVAVEALQQFFSREGTQAAVVVVVLEFGLEAPGTTEEEFPLVVGQLPTLRLHSKCLLGLSTSQELQEVAETAPRGPIHLIRKMVDHLEVQQPITGKTASSLIESTVAIGKHLLTLAQTRHWWWVDFEKYFLTRH